ncbi:MAG: hypothetical protein ABL901_17035 [Hyphomicrobiaceae bacterium]
MVAARRRVLDSGVYAPIADRVAAQVMELVRERERERERERVFCVVDAGCGEGYYLQQIERRLVAEGLISFCKTNDRKEVIDFESVLPDGGSSPLGARMAKRSMSSLAGIAPALIGVDISKWAVQAAAKRTKGCFWAVATNRHLPIAAGNAELILCMFGFPVWEAFASVQPPCGHVLMVDPGPDHLIELRSIIYPSVHRSEVASAAPEGAHAHYEIRNEERVQFEVELYNRTQISDLLAMTPHDHRAPLAGREALARYDRLRVTVDVVFKLMRLRG